MWRHVVWKEFTYHIIYIIYPIISYIIYVPSIDPYRITKSIWIWK